MIHKLQELKQQPKVKISPHGFCFYVASKREAIALIEAEFNDLAKIAYTGGFKATTIYYPGCRYPTEIYAAQYKGSFNNIKTMNKELEELEQDLKILLGEPKPQPKYKQWQTVKLPERREGRIVGCYFVSVGIAYADMGADDQEAGWCYYLEDGLNLRVLHEDTIDKCNK